MAITGLEAEGTRGSCGIVGAPAATNQSCMAVFPLREKLIVEYLFHYYVFCGKSLALKYCQGTKQQSYTAGLVKKLPISLPSGVDEQAAIAIVLSDITSYNPQAQDVTLEETGANSETDKQFLYNTYTALLKEVEPAPNKSKTETYEDWAKNLFKDQPANMRLLIVVDKLLTGFDAPHCTYLYIDKSMQDHGLFQAICRTNRLDGDDKPFGYIVDYKDLFNKVQGAISVYTSEVDHDDAGGGSPDIILQDRLKKGRQRLDGALEGIALLCEPVQPPQGELEHIHYFCGNTEKVDDLKATEPQRVALYQATVALVRAYANIADEMSKAGYTQTEIEKIKREIDVYLKLREIIRQASGETIDLKAYEADIQ